MARKIKRLPFLLFAALALAPVSAPLPAAAHPHAFAEARVEFAFDRDGLAGIAQEWTLDRMLTATILAAIRENHDGVLGPEEIQAIKRMSFDNLGSHRYFTAVSVDGRPFEVKRATDFTARAEKGHLVYSFFIPCPVRASGQDQEVALAVFDSTFYTFISYSTDGESTINPEDDPLFANPAAPARPEDFQRFSEAVGLDAYSGEVLVKGDTRPFAIRTEVREASEWAYFHGQIIPEALVVRFKSKEPRSP